MYNPCHSVQPTFVVQVFKRSNVALAEFEQVFVSTCDLEKPVVTALHSTCRNLPPDNNIFHIYI